MPVLKKLSCGIIYTDAFEAHLTAFHTRHAEDHLRHILTFDYIRCATGPDRGKAWCQLIWTPLDATPAHRRHLIGSVPVYFSKASQHGLRERCLHHEEGRLVVIP